MRIASCPALASSSLISVVLVEGCRPLITILSSFDCLHMYDNLYYAHYGSPVI